MGANQQYEALVVGLEQHNIRVAEGSVFDLHQQFVLARFWYWHLVEVELVVARIVSGISISNAPVTKAALVGIRILLRKHSVGTHHGGWNGRFLDGLQTEKEG